MKRVIAVCIFTAVGLAGCATAYQRDGFTGGFSETQLDENVWRVKFEGNGYTRDQTAEDFALLRSAELTIEKGYTHFALAGSRSSSETGAFTTPTTAYTTGNAYVTGNNIRGNATTTYQGGQTFIISRPTTNNTVVMFKGKPEIQGLVYDANFICQSLGKTHGVTCGATK